jgi:hypothetical protein
VVMTTVESRNNSYGACGFGAGGSEVEGGWADSFRCRMICAIIIRLGKHHCVAQPQWLSLSNGTCAPARTQVPSPPSHDERVIIPGFGFLSWAIPYSLLNMRPLVKSSFGFASWRG